MGEGSGPSLESAQGYVGSSMNVAIAHLESLASSLINVRAVVAITRSSGVMEQGDRQRTTLVKSRLTIYLLSLLILLCYIGYLLCFNVNDLWGCSQLLTH